MHILTQKIAFPNVELANEEGILAIGGDLEPERLLLAYKNGIFPWYNEDEPIIWWCPDPRFVLFPTEMRVSASMKTILQNGKFRFTINKAFDQVIRQCRLIRRAGQEGTWITDAVEEAYGKMRQLGFAHSAEAWKNGCLVGGLYGIRLGNIFFGESMFSHASNASKFAFINYTEELKREGVVVIDCQVYTQHLESLGAKMIERKRFIELLKNNIAI